MMDLEIEVSVYMLFKRTHDFSMLNPYFMFDGNRFVMPEAIDYIMPRAEEEILACPGETLTEKGKYWSYPELLEKNNGSVTVDRSRSRALQIENVLVETDPFLRPAETGRLGLLPAQVFFMKTAHEYYILHCYMEHRFQTLQKRQYDRDKIFSLMRNADLRWGDFAQNTDGFNELRWKAHEQVSKKIL